VRHGPEQVSGGTIRTEIRAPDRTDDR